MADNNGRNHQFYEDGYETPDLEHDFLSPLHHFSQALAEQVFSIQKVPKPDDMTGKAFRDQQIAEAGSVFASLLGHEVTVNWGPNDDTKYRFDLVATRVPFKGEPRSVAIINPKFDDMYLPKLDYLREQFLQKLEE